MLKPTELEVWDAFKSTMLKEGRLSETDVILLRWVRPRWDGDDQFKLDYPQGADLERLAEILRKNFGLWDSLLPWTVELAWGDEYQVVPELPDETHNTDMGNATRLVHWHGDKLLFCHLWNRWLTWDGKRWEVDGTAQVERLAKATVRTIYTEAGSHSDDKERRATAKWAMRSEARERINAMIKLAASEIPILPDDLDANPWLLTVANGILNLRSGELLPHDPEYLSTKLVGVEYDRAAECPLWLQFLDEILAGDENMIRFLQRAVGYSLTGDVSERCLFILHGCGANGKTTFLEVIRALLGDYALRTPTETLMLKQSGSIPNDVARLKGARFVSASESEEGRRLAESLIKDITGGDTISARFMRAEWFDFTPECKVWLATNHKPEIRGTDRAIWDRIKLIPFEVIIPETEQDKHLTDKLTRELPGILAWAVEGCLAWQRDGLGVADRVKAATAAYRNEQDALGEFIEDCCIEGDDKEALASDLYSAYKLWGGDLSQRKFGLTLRERGYIKERRTEDPHKGRIQWLGIGLVNLNAPVNLSEPISGLAACNQEFTPNNRNKVHQGSPRFTKAVPDDPLIEVARALGGEVMETITLGDGTQVPF